MSRQGWRYERATVKPQKKTTARLEQYCYNRAGGGWVRQVDMVQTLTAVYADNVNDRNVYREREWKGCYCRVDFRIISFTLTNQGSASSFRFHTVSNVLCNTGPTNKLEILRFSHDNNDTWNHWQIRNSYTMITCSKVFGPPVPGVSHPIRYFQWFSFYS